MNPNSTERHPSVYLNSLVNDGVSLSSLLDVLWEQRVGEREWIKWLDSKAGFWFCKGEIHAHLFQYAEQW